MSQHQGDEMDYAADDYEMAEVDDDMYFRGRVMGDSESDDDDEYDHLVCSFPTLNSALIIIWFSSSQNIVHVCLAIFIFSFCLSLPTKHKKENVEFLCKIFSFSFFFLVQDNKIPDTSAADARKGKDIQGIPWERLSISREKYRLTRLEQYKNYENIPHSGEGSEKVIFSLGSSGITLYL